jgi:hypothetical protein
MPGKMGKRHKRKNSRIRKALIDDQGFFLITGGPNGIRTRVTDVRGQCPRPLDDGTLLIEIQITKYQIPNKLKLPNTQTTKTYVLECHF